MVLEEDEAAVMSLVGLFSVLTNLKCNCSDFLGYLFYCLNMIA